jgi:UDP-glucose 4-epimerase
MKILVTGGLGFIGSHTVVALQNEGFEVIAVDNLSNSSLEVLDGIERITGKTFQVSFILPLQKPWAKVSKIRCCIMKTTSIR